jgi:hypothetical protein
MMNAAGEELLQRRVCTQKLLGTEAFTQRSLYTEKVLHAEAFSHRSVYIHIHEYVQKT